VEGNGGGTRRVPHPDEGGVEVPDPEAWGVAYVMSHGASFFSGPTVLNIPPESPYAHSLGGLSASLNFSVYRDVRLFFVAQQVTDIYTGPYTVTATLWENLDSGEPDGPDNPRDLDPEGAFSSAYLQDWKDMDFFRLSVPPDLVGEVLEVEVDSDSDLSGVMVSYDGGETPDMGVYAEDFTIDTRQGLPQPGCL